MSRLLSAMKTDVTVQLRNNLYAIGVGVSLLVAAVLSQLAGPQHLAGAIPALLLLIAGGSTLLYVAGMIIFEKDEGTLNAVIVSPLRTSEYLWSKIATLTALATLEGLVMVGGTMLIMGWFGENGAALTMPNAAILLLGIVAIGVIYTLIGVILIVRFDRITDFLVPMSGVAVVLQLPFLYFVDWVVHPLLLLIPTSAPTMIMKGAYVPLSTGQWLYALGYTALLLTVLAIWAYRAFQTHIIMKVG